jgi:lysophospholipase L1-like esterase
MYGEENRDGWLATKGHLREMDARVRQHGGRLLVALWPLLVGLEGPYPFERVHATLGDFFREAGIRHHDLLPDLRGRPSASLWVHRVDHHPNEEGHRIAAEALAPLVADLVALPPAGAVPTRR